MARSGGLTGEVAYDGAGAAFAGDGTPAKPVPPALPRQRRTGMLALAVLLIGLGALLAAYLVLSLSQRVTAVIMVRDVPVGTPLTAADVGTTMVSVEASVQIIPGAQLSAIPGKVAGTTLHAGTLLSASELTATLTPQVGQQVVPVALPPSLMPARGLYPGDQVLVVVIQGSQQGQGQPTQGTAASQDLPAVVDRVGAPGPDGRTVVDLLVSDSQGPDLARLAAAGRVALDLTPRRS